jgi:hypothetical protein
MAVRAPLVSIVLPAPGLPAPLDVLRRLVAHPRPFLRFAAGGPADLATWSYAGCDPVETLDLPMAGTSGPRRRAARPSGSPRCPRRGTTPSSPGTTVATARS